MKSTEIWSIKDQPSTIKIRIFTQKNEDIHLLGKQVADSSQRQWSHKEWHVPGD